MPAHPSAGFQYRLATTDFDELAHAFRGWDASFRQLSRGSFAGSLHLIQAGAVQLIRVRSNRRILARGLMKPGNYAFTAIGPGNADATWRGQHLAPGQINVNQPDGVMDHLSSAPYESLLLGIDRERLYRLVYQHSGADVATLLRGCTSIDAGPEAAQELQSLLLDLFDQTSRQSGTLLPGGREIERQCVARLLRILTQAGPVATGAMRSGRLDLVRRVEGFLREHLHQPLLTEDLCREFDVSERTLRYVFHEVFGLSPLAFFKTLRLNAVRAELKRNQPGEPVHEVAERWGFAHTGNFAADYRRQFGELPSTTVAG